MHVCMEMWGEFEKKIECYQKKKFFFKIMLKQLLSFFKQIEVFRKIFKEVFRKLYREAFENF